MSNRIKATVNPALLIWARTTTGYELAGAAEALGINREKLEAWEEGEDQPSIPQLRKLAELYKRPLAVLYLPEPPQAFQPMQDFRRLPDSGPHRFSPGLTLDIRSAQQRRLLALEMFEEVKEKPPVFDLRTSLHEDAENVGLQLRERFKITYDLQVRWREPRIAFHAWRDKIEQVGVLVFQANRVETDEASGFAYWAKTLPVIVVNRKDVFARRVFSLLHELVHLMLHQSGVSDLDIDSARPAREKTVEVFCNAVAAAALMPKDIFLAERAIDERGPGRHEWTDNTVQSLATLFGVSQESVIRRLLTFGRTTEAFYSRKRAQYSDEFRAKKEREREQRADKSMARNVPRETVGDLGRPFVRLVLENFRQDRLTLSDVSGYLGVKVRHVPNIEQQIGYF
ncbi:MAG: XRE family transcriptional regulator [Beijerinckiaceae bacterium]|nr:XRE family transcriptional regulator [Beijerinckiaceae bacterium]MCI0736472.1 XRE family transcriptional regulator [Beijerinckiaceae bacterium]